MSSLAERKTQKKRFLFVDVQDYPPVMEHVRRFFNEDIAALYGDQSRALKKIEAGEDRACEVLVSSEDREELGLIVYKSDLTEEYAEQGHPHTFEIKTLVVLNSKKNAGRRIASHLLHRLAHKAVDLKANAVTITVSSSKPETLAFCLKYGFRNERHSKNHYVDGLDEFFLFHPNPEKLLSTVSFEILAEGSNHHTKLQKKFSDPIEFSAIEKSFLEFYFKGKTRLDALRGVNTYFGTELGPMLVNETLSKLRLHHFKWQTESVSDDYTILFVNPLFESAENKELLGYVFVGIQPNGKREILGTCLPALQQNSYWVDLFKDLRVQGLDHIDIICAPPEIKLSREVEELYQDVRIVSSTALKSWSSANFIPHSLGLELVDEMVMLKETCSVKTKSTVSTKI